MEPAHWIALLVFGAVVIGFLVKHDETQDRDTASPPARPPPAPVIASRHVDRAVTLHDSAASPIRAEHDDGDDDGYAIFVAGCFRDATIRCGDIAIEVNGVLCRLHSLTPASGRPPYVNLLWGPQRTRKSFAADTRHRWSVAGREMTAGVFAAMLRGAPVQMALQPDDHPTTPDEALARDRFETAGRRFLLQYRDNSGVVTWRVISRLQRGPEHLYALCHLRWGDLRHFAYDRILTLSDAESGERIDVAAYAARVIDLPARRRKRK